MTASRVLQQRVLGDLGLVPPRVSATARADDRSSVMAAASGLRVLIGDEALVRIELDLRYGARSKLTGPRSWVHLL